MWISYGGIQEVSEEEVVYSPSDSASQENRRKVFNTHLLVNDEGHQMAVYRKIHLFDVSVPQGPILRESRYTSRGATEDENLIVVPSPFGFSRFLIRFSSFHV